jgi:hypothetical protein
MPSNVTDLTIPAHDPTIPKPRGLLPVPPYIEEGIASDQARIGPYYTDEYAKQSRDDQTLNYYYEGTYVVARRTPQGVEVLAVGWDEVSKYLDDHPFETGQDLRIGRV